MQPCPRQTNEATLSVQLAHESHWREDDTCSYCGSISPARFFAAIAAGSELGPTDKNYKVYVRVPNPRAGQERVVSISNAPTAPDWGGRPWRRVRDLSPALRQTWPGCERRPDDWALVGDEGETVQEKFYFQHLDEDGRLRFVDLLNARRLNIGAPGHFYRLPFFCVVQPRGDAR